MRSSSSGSCEGLANKWWAKKRVFRIIFLDIPMTQKMSVYKLRLLKTFFFLTFSKYRFLIYKLMKKTKNNTIKKFVFCRHRKISACPSATVIFSKFPLQKTKMKVCYLLYVNRFAKILTKSCSAPLEIYLINSIANK